MFNTYLIGLGVIAIPFFFVSGYDTRAPKMELAVFISLLLGLSVLYRGLMKPIKNIWLMVLFLFMLAGIHLSPKPDIQLADMTVANFWVWYPMFNILVFFLFFSSIASIDFNKTMILNLITYTGVIMSAYVFFQWFGFDQFYRTIGGGQGAEKLAGTLGNRGITSAFIAMIIPIAVHLKKYVFAVFMALSVLLMGISFSIGAMISSMLFMVGASLKGWNRAIFISALLAVALVIIINIQRLNHKEYFNDHGRFQVWRNIVTDIKTPPVKDGNKSYPFTGFGIGSFKYIYHVNHPADKWGSFKEAHNDYMELLYNCGFAGLFLFLAAIWWMIKRGFIVSNGYRIALFSSFLCASINACGLFVWQMAPIIFNTLIVCGLLHKEEDHGD